MDLITNLPTVLYMRTEIYLPQPFQTQTGEFKTQPATATSYCLLGCSETPDQTDKTGISPSYTWHPLVVLVISTWLNVHLTHLGYLGYQYMTECTPGIPWLSWSSVYGSTYT